MKTLSKTAKVFDIVLKIAFWVCVAGIVAVSVVFVGCLVLDDAAFLSDVSTSVNLGPAEFVLAEGVAVADGSFVNTYGAIVVVSAVASLVISCFFLRFFRKLLKPLIEERPFDGTISKSLRILSFVELIGGFVLSLLEWGGQLAMTKLYDLNSLFLSDKIKEIHFENEIDGSFIVYFGLIYMLSLIFKYGEELQKQSDETL